MEVRVLYLDIDDEITTAAARVRGADGTRVAMVLPNGSRVATSRINFRLLARDATLNGKRLSIIAGDAATRALAASAGLPIFSTVAEYESAIEVERGVKAGGDAAEEPAIETETQATSARSARSGGRTRPRAPAATGDETLAAVVAPPTEGPPAPAPVTAASAMVAAEPLAAVTAAQPVGPIVPSSRAPAAVPAARVVADTPVDRSPDAPVRAAGSRVIRSPFGGTLSSRTLRMPLAIGAAILALALVVGGVGAYVFLPTATAVIAPRETAIGPVPLRIVASPTATEPDPVGNVVPAETNTIDVEATQTFPVKGKRVEETKAAGTVRFRNKDFTSTNTIPRGSIVSTQSGIRFRTDRSVTVPRAELVGLQIFPASANVRATAVNAGPAGNVEPNTILVIPRGEDPQTLDVTNPDATEGGERNEFPRVGQADLDAATKAIEDQLTTTFAERLTDPDLGGDGTTVFAETASLGDATYTIDPATLLGDEVETFDLSATASGTVLAVDEAAVQVVAEANIASQVEAGHALVDGSSQVEASRGQVEAGVITFPAIITARQVLVLDPDAIEIEIRGKTLAEAQSILERYGRTELTVWPDWVGTIPTLDARVEVRTTSPEASS